MKRTVRFRLSKTEVSGQVLSSTFQTFEITSNKYIINLLYYFS